MSFFFLAGAGEFIGALWIWCLGLCDLVVKLFVKGVYLDVRQDSVRSRTMISIRSINKLSHIHIHICLQPFYLYRCG